MSCLAQYRPSTSAPGAGGKYTISTSNIKAQFIPYGATLTNLFVKDKSGNDVDVVLGSDDLQKTRATQSTTPYRDVTGTNNWSYRTWNVTAATDISITFSVSDATNSSLGILGNAETSVTYSVTNSTWNIKMEAISPNRKHVGFLRPGSSIFRRNRSLIIVYAALMLNQHTYFNLDAYRNPDTDKIWNHTLYLPFSGRYLQADQGALPTGKVLTGSVGNINDFASTPDMQLGHATGQPGFENNCEADGACEGYNDYWVVEDAPCNAVVARLTSPFSGIKAELRTDQPGVVVYSCNWFDGTAALKSTQGLSDRRNVTRSSFVALEVDGINQPWKDV
ncbi:aldose 1-epimerase [Seiridium cupressi]